MQSLVLKYRGLEAGLRPHGPRIPIGRIPPVPPSFFGGLPLSSLLFLERPQKETSPWIGRSRSPATPIYERRTNVLEIEITFRVAQAT